MTTNRTMADQSADLPESDFGPVSFVERPLDWAGRERRLFCNDEGRLFTKTLERLIILERSGELADTAPSFGVPEDIVQVISEGYVQTKTEAYVRKIDRSRPELGLRARPEDFRLQLTCELTASGDFIASAQIAEVQRSGARSLISSVPTDSDRQEMFRVSMGTAPEIDVRRDGTQSGAESYLKYAVSLCVGSLYFLRAAQLSELMPIEMLSYPCVELNEVGTPLRFVNVDPAVEISALREDLHWLENWSSNFSLDDFLEVCAHRTSAQGKLNEVSVAGDFSEVDWANSDRGPQQVLDLVSRLERHGSLDRSAMARPAVYGTH